MSKKLLMFAIIPIILILTLMPVHAGWFEDWFSISSGRKIVSWKTTAAECAAAECTPWETYSGSGYYEYYLSCSYSADGYCLCQSTSPNKPSSCTGGNTCAYTSSTCPTWTTCTANTKYCTAAYCGSISASCGICSYSGNTLSVGQGICSSAGTGYYSCDGSGGTLSAVHSCASGTSCTPYSISSLPSSICKTTATCESLGYLSSTVSGQACTTHVIASAGLTCYSCVSSDTCAYTASTCPATSWSECSESGSQYCICTNVTRPCNPPNACAKLGYLWEPPSADLTCEQVPISTFVVCFTNCSGSTVDNKTLPGGNAISMTREAFNTATAQSISYSMCNLGGECSKTNIIADESINVEDYNWTVACMKSNEILEQNKLAFGMFLKEQAQEGGWFDSFPGFFDKLFKTATQAQYEEYCEKHYSDGALGSISRYLFGDYSAAKCQDLLNNVPQGTCRATIKASALGFCWPQANTWLSPYTGQNDCQTNTIILIIGGFVALFVVSKLLGKF